MTSGSTKAKRLSSSTSRSRSTAPNSPRRSFEACRERGRSALYFVVRTGQGVTRRWLPGVSGAGAIVLGVSGWLSGSDSDTATQEPSSTTPASAASPTSTGMSPSATTTSATSTTSAAPTTSTPLTADQLVLSPDQLPGAGWKPDDDGDLESTERQEASQPECSNQSWTLRTDEMTDQAGAAWSFDQAAEVEAITSQAFVYRDEQAAATALAAYRDVVERCVPWQMGAGATGYTFEVTRELSMLRSGTSLLLACRPRPRSGIRMCLQAGVMGSAPGWEHRLCRSPIVRGPCSAAGKANPGGRTGSDRRPTGADPHRIEREHTVNTNRPITSALDRI